MGERQMNSRERVRTVLSGGIPDRVPVDIGGTLVTGIHVDAYLALAEYLKLDLELPRVYDTYQMLARIGEEIRRYMGADVLQIENDSASWFGIKNRDWYPWVNTSGNQVLVPGGFRLEERENRYLYLRNKKGDDIGVLAPDALYVHKLYPEGHFHTFDENPTDPDKWRKELPVYDDEELRNIENRAKFWYENSDYSLFGAFERGRLSSSTSFAHYELVEWMTIMMSEPEYAFEIVEATAECAVENLSLYLQACGKYLDALIVSPADYGLQNSPMMATDVFEEIYVPNYKKITDHLHANSQVKAFFHSCGSIRPLLPSFVRMGCDIINPIQTSAANMDPQTLKDEFGGKLVFWGGGADTQNTLPYGSPEDVYNEVKERLRIFMPGGHYVFAATQNIQPDVRPENIAAIREAIRDYGSYSSSAG